MVSADVLTSVALLSSILLLGVGCSFIGSDSAEEDLQIYQFELREGKQGWTGGFADYPPGREEDLNLEVDYRSLPSSTGKEGHALYIAGWNYSDDLFMFFKRRIEGLDPGAQYAASFEIEIASRAPSSCGGVGGLPGKSVYMKAGASTIEPVPEEVKEGGHVRYRMNIDKGNQSKGGENAVVIGHIGIPGDCEAAREQGYPFHLKRLKSEEKTVPVQADDKGRLWLVAGTDSGFEAQTILYYTEITAKLKPL